MSLILHGLKNCDTCRKAIKTLEASGHKVTFSDVRADGITKAQITKWAKAVSWEALLNTRSTTWRALSDADKTAPTQTKAVALMLEHPTLIKRPVIESDGNITVGWTKDVQGRFCR